MVVHRVFAARIYSISRIPFFAYRNCGNDVCILHSDGCIFNHSVRHSTITENQVNVNPVRVLGFRLGLLFQIDVHICGFYCTVHYFG